MSVKSIVYSVVTYCWLVVAFPISFFAQQKPVIAGEIDNSQRVTLPGSKHPLAQAQFEVGTLAPGTRLERMLLVLGPTAERASDLQNFLDSQHDRSSANYHHWLTPDEFGLKFGPAPQDLQRVKVWLQQQGFTVTSVARSGGWIEFSGTSAQVERAMGTMMRRYSVGSRMHLANAVEISLPVAIAPAVKGIVSLHDFFKKPMLGRYMEARRKGDGSFSPITPQATLSGPNGVIHALTPGDYSKIYDLAPLYARTPTPLNGLGATIAIVARSDVNSTDVLEFEQITGLAGSNVPTNILTAPPDPGLDLVTGDGVEATLDAEWAQAMAPAALVDVVVSASTATSDGVDLSSAYIVDHNLAGVMSVSFGECEADLGPAENTFFNNLWQQAAAQGISVLVASGDSGAAGCDFVVQPTPATRGLAVSGVASTPFNTAVGGTQFSDVGNDAFFWASANTSSGVSVIGYIPEMAWNETCDPTTANSPCATTGFVLASSGGGSSSIYAKPVWQLGIGITATRDIPDVSLTAADHDGYIICFNLSCASNQVGIVGGTSASSPSFAGMMAIVNQALGRQGLANYDLYRLKLDSCSSSARTAPLAPPPAGCVFNDITVGNNSVPGLPGFSTGLGLDQATGLGSVNAANLVTAWAAITLQPTTTTLTSNGATSISATHGQVVLLNAHVTGGAAPPAPSGAVALAGTGPGPITSLELLTPVNSNVGAFDGGVTDLPGGTYTMTAHYPGDGQFAPSDSNAVSVNISSEGSTTALRLFGVSATGLPVTATSFPYGSFMDLHADVAGFSGQGRATGNVTYQDTTAGVVLGSAAVNLKNEAELILPPGRNFAPVPLTVGPHSLIAAYNGDSSFITSRSAPTLITITRGNPVVTVDPQIPIIATQANTINASVAPTGNIIPTGTVQLLDAGAPFGSPLALQNGQAVFPAAFDTEGTHAISATYSGDGTYNGIASAPLPVIVVAPFAITGGANQTVAAGQTATYALFVAATRTPTTFSGTVTLSCSAPAGITCTLSPTSAVVTPTSSATLIGATVTTSLSAGLEKGKFPRWPLALSGIAAVALAGMARRSRRPLSLISMVLLALTIGACGGGGSATNTVTPTPAPTPIPPTHAIVLVNGVSGIHTTSIPLNLTITH
jgi:large repetitive protein